jgi:hypothetical protein
MTAEPIAPVPNPVAPVAPRKDRGTQLLLLLAGLVAVAGIAFAVGRVTAPAPAAAATGRFGNGNFGAGFGNGAGASVAPGAGRGLFGGAAGTEATVRGTVRSVTPTSITVKLANGQTASVDLTATTTYHRQAAASSTDIARGAQVDVQVTFQPRAAGATPAPSGGPRTFTASDVTLAGQ